MRALVPIVPTIALTTMAGIATMVLAGTAVAQAPMASMGPNPSVDLVYVCPDDPTIRSYTRDLGSRCKHAPVAMVAEPLSYRLDLDVSPNPPAVDQPTALTFVVRDPWTGQPANDFLVVHEQLFHLFVVSEDLEFFHHGHPTFRSDDEGGEFEYALTLPKSGMFRLLGDFFPDGATPQALTQTLFVPGEAPGPATLRRDDGPKAGENMRVSLRTTPAQPVAGQRTQMRFTVDPGDGFELYLGAWAHAFTASDDLVDLLHGHPLLADGSPELEFAMTFPRARTYRVWAQFQRNGVVNTVHFDLPVAPAP